MIAKPRGCRSDAGGNARRPEQNEAADDHRGPPAKLQAAGEHHDSHRRDRNHRDRCRDRAEQRVLQPQHRRHERTGARGIAERP